MSKILVENIGASYEVQPGEGNRPTMICGRFQMSDMENGNKRKYSRKLWEKVLGSDKIKESLARRRMFGEIRHPDHSEINIKESAILITKLDLKQNGEVYGEAEVLEDLPGLPGTPNGNILGALLRRGCELGISSRGIGDIRQINGETYVNEDTFQLITFDMTQEPSTPGAWTAKMAENQERIYSVAEELLRSGITEKEATILMKVAECLLPESAAKSIRDKVTHSLIGEDYVNNKSYYMLGENTNSNSANKALVEQLENTVAEKTVLQQQLTAVQKSLSEATASISAKDKKIADLSSVNEKNKTSFDNAKKLSGELASTQRKLTIAQELAESFKTKYENTAKNQDALRARLTEANDKIKQISEKTDGKNYKALYQEAAHVINEMASLYADSVLVSEDLSDLVQNGHFMSQAHKGRATELEEKYNVAVDLLSNLQEEISRENITKFAETALAKVGGYSKFKDIIDRCYSLTEAKEVVKQLRVKLQESAAPSTEAKTTETPATKVTESTETGKKPSVWDIPNQRGSREALIENANKHSKPLPQNQAKVYNHVPNFNGSNAVLTEQNTNGGVTPAPATNTAKTQSDLAAIIKLAAKRG